MTSRKDEKQRAPLLPPADSDDSTGYTDLGQLPHVSPDEPAVDGYPGLAPLKPESERALRRLARYRPPKDRWPMRRRAAVLVALFGGRHGDLYVVLSRRSSKMRTHPGDVALPGGKLEPDDLDLKYTARREAYEEIGLPINNETVRYLCSLRPFLTRTNLIVTPVVVYILDPSIEPELNPDEVDSVFSHPLQSFLFNTPREPVLHGLSEDVQRSRRPYHMSWDLPWLHGKPYRWHRFESKRLPIIGFTSDILIEVAEIAYGKPDFERRAPGQLSRRRLLEIAVTDPIFQDPEKAAEAEEPREAVKAKL